MPLFDFTCRRCSHTFEALVRPGHSVTCRACESPDLDQLPASFAPSSEGMRRASLDGARKVAEGQRAERRRAEHREMKHHLHDH